MSPVRNLYCLNKQRRFIFQKCGICRNKDRKSTAACEGLRSSQTQRTQEELKEAVNLIFGRKSKLQVLLYSMLNFLCIRVDQQDSKVSNINNCRKINIGMILFSQIQGEMFSNLNLSLLQQPAQLKYIRPVILLNLRRSCYELG